MQRVFLIVSIDTECDKGPSWKIKVPMSFQNILEGVPERLVPLFVRYGIKATYLLSPEIIRNNACALVFKSLSNAELGTHLHEEFIEPFPKWSVDRTKSVQRDLAPMLEREKLVQLTSLFEDQFGFRPLSFRAGRFGISNRTFTYLRSLGYSVDSSVTPFKTHYYESGTINNFWGRGLMPYRVAGNKLLQVPVTIFNRDFSSLPPWVLRFVQDKRTFSKRALNRLGFKSKSEWFRPYRSSGQELIRIAEQVIRCWPRDKDPVLNMMFHSNEIIPGASPYCETQDDVDKYLASLTHVFEYLQQRYEVCSVGLGEYAKFYR